MIDLLTIYARLGMAMNPSALVALHAAAFQAALDNYDGIDRWAPEGARIHYHRHEHPLPPIHEHEGYPEGPRDGRYQ